MTTVTTFVLNVQNSLNCLLLTIGYVAVLIQTIKIIGPYNLDYSQVLDIRYWIFES